MPQTLQQILNDPAAQNITTVADLKAQAKAVEATFIASLKAQVPTPQEQEDIAWATTAITAAPVLSVGATPEIVAALDQAKLDGESILANIAAAHGHDAQAIADATRAAAMQAFQAFVLKGEQVALTALLGALVAA